MVLRLLLIVAYSLFTFSHAAEVWQSCEIFMAPSSLPTGGWGVFAGRDYEEHEVVELAPLFIPVSYDNPIVANSVLDDYIYGYARWEEATQGYTYFNAVVVMGHAMFFNHHAEPNLKWSMFAREPTANEPRISQAVGFLSTRKIEAGEELFSTYGSDDGGVTWFTDRGLQLQTVPTYASRKNGTVLVNDMKTYCSKVYAGWGRNTWNQRVKPGMRQGETFILDENRLAPYDHFSALAKEDVQAGTVLEMAPGLVVTRNHVLNSPIAPISFFWEDWDSSQQQALIDLYASKDLRVQHQDDASNWVRIEVKVEDFSNVVIVPAAGSIASVERASSDPEKANCRIEIVPSGSMKSHLDHGGADGSAGIILKLVATKNIGTGEQLRLAQPVSASVADMQLFVDELQRCGEPIPDKFAHLFLHPSKDEL